MPSRDHISVCICTYKRPALLMRLLAGLQEQQTCDLFDYSLVVVDNDKHETGRSTVQAFSSRASLALRYLVEPEQNIALARNKAVSGATGNLVAFIDDDETPTREWLLRLYQARIGYQSDGVFGPVESIFEEEPPKWMVRAGLFERPNYAKTGMVIEWKRTGMGNVLVRRSVLDRVDGPFAREFGSGGEDVDFFRRAIQSGYVFVWCSEAIVHEVVPVERTRMSFQVRRALLRGKTSLRQPGGKTMGVAKSLLASLLYTALLPAFLLLGRHVFVRYLVKDLDHLGKLIAACGVDLVKEKYVLK